MENYYNRHKPEKGYKELLFIAGRGLQSAELNELQSYIREDLGEIASALLKDGGLLSGGSFSYNKEAKTITLEEAKIIHKKVYIATAPRTTLQIEGQGKETIGIAVKEKIITELEDPHLRDPAVGFENFNQAGALRKQILARWTTAKQVEREEIFYPIYEFIDGQPVTPKKQTPQLTGALQLLAKYDYSANGSYVVSGMAVEFDHVDDETKQIILTVKEGTAHVEGYEITFPYSQKVRINPPTDTSKVFAEPHTFKKDGKYKLRNTPIAKILRITGVKQETTQITHQSYSGAKDKLPKTPVVDILEVRQGSTVFEEGKDYVISGDYIDWSLNGKEPSPGSSYTVVYRYQDTNIKATVTADKQTIIVNDLAPDTLFYVDYEYYLPRIDRVLLTKEGNLKVLKGVASEDPQPPQIVGGLSLATVKVAYGQPPQIETEYYRAFKMSDIQKLFEKISQIEYNIAKLSLIENARSIDPTTTKKGIFADPFYDDDLRDLGYQQTAQIINKTLQPAINWKQKVVRQGQPIQLPSTEKLYVNQDSYTKTRKINRFTWSDAPPAYMQISPRSYRWIDSQIVKQLEGGRTSWQTIDEKIVSATLKQDLNVNITAKKFNAGETVYVYFDGKKVKHLTADQNGTVKGTITIPAGTKSGNKQILLKGKDSKITAEDVISLLPIQRTITIYRRTIFNDPIAQTFTTENDVIPSAVEIHFEQPPENGFVEVMICETQVGIPDRKAVITKARLEKEQITKGWNKFTFDTPVILQEKREYAIVVETTDTNARIRTAKLGQWDRQNKRWLTSQAYDVGVLLESANSSTWTPIQDEDLTFKLYIKQFTKEQNVQIGEVQVENATDLVLNASVNNPSGCITSFKVVLPDKTEKTIYPFKRLQIPKTTGKVKIIATLKTENQNLSPTIEGDVYLSVGQVAKESTYVSRAFETKGDTLKVYLEVKETENAKVKVYCQIGNNWEEMTREKQATPTSDGFIETTFVKTGINQKQTRIKIILQANEEERTYAKNLRAVIT